MINFSSSSSENSGEVNRLKYNSVFLIGGHMDKIISIKEARKILGKNYDELDDIQIENVINSLSFIAREMLEKASKGELLKQKIQPSRSNPDSID
tara:strand:- start:5161 stop:5445 length:285 start_codon:yes stop_codon:yes gene_type:complete